jgi:hypothetical protein
VTILLSKFPSKSIHLSMDPDNRDKQGRHKEGEKDTESSKVPTKVATRLPCKLVEQHVVTMKALEEQSEHKDHHGDIVVLVGGSDRKQHIA